MEQEKEQLFSQGLVQDKSQHLRRSTFQALRQAQRPQAGYMEQRLYLLLGIHVCCMCTNNMIIVARIVTGGSTEKGAQFPTQVLVLIFDCSCSKNI